MTALAPNFATLPPIPAWAVMWALALAIFFACKGVTWVAEVKAGGCRRRLAPVGRTTSAAAYFIAWPGMDAERFMLRGAPRHVPWARAFHALARTAIGAMLVWGVVPSVSPTHPLLAGWIGMVGLILVLHFGFLDLLGILWHARGVDAAPLMNAPTHATSLADFWGRRWNTAFHHLAQRYVFAPLRRPLGIAGATLATFLASGVVHDLVVSVPARGGYGLPTLYFLIQGAGVLFERTKLARRAVRRSSPQAGLGRGLPGRAFAAIVILAPLPWLFHEPFVTRVILPFLEVFR